MMSSVRPEVSKPVLSLSKGVNSTFYEIINSQARSFLASSATLWPSLAAFSPVL